jgi:hypothetical protein
LLALSRAAKSIPIYQAGGDAVRQLVTDYRARMDDALRHGDLDLEVRPFELVLDGVVVYLERDRERSLAFLLFRDGIRRLTIRTSVPWDELVRLLEILLVRVATLRQQEDDTVTLLGKAGFGHVSIVAIDGFTEDQDDAYDFVGAQAEASDDPAQTALRTDVPRDWDLPGPPLLHPTPLVYRDLSDHSLALLRAETAAGTLPALTLQLARELLVVAASPVDPTTYADLVGILGEIRDHLLVEGELVFACRLAHLVREAPGAAEPLASVLAGYATDRTVRAFLRWAGTQPSLPTAALLRKHLDVLPGDHLGFLLDQAATTEDAGALQAACHVLAAYVPDRGDALLARLRDAPPLFANELVSLFAAAAPDRPLELAARIAHRDEPVLLARVERLLAEVTKPTDTDVAPLVALFRCTRPGVRIRAAQLLGRVGSAAAVAALRARVEDGADAGLEPAEAIALGDAIAAAGGEAETTLFEGWIRPAGFFQRLASTIPRTEAFAYAAVAGLAALDPVAHAPTIRWLARTARPALKEFCIRTLAAARKEPGRG